jgi:hypothetical protein
MIYSCIYLIDHGRYSIQAFKKEADKLASIEFELIEKAVALEKRKSDLKEVHWPMDLKIIPPTNYSCDLENCSGGRCVGRE